MILHNTAYPIKTTGPKIGWKEGPAAKPRYDDPRKICLIYQLSSSGRTSIPKGECGEKLASLTRRFA